VPDREQAFSRRRIHCDVIERDDYSVIDDSGYGSGEAWNWSIIPGVPTPPAGSSGQAETFGAAKIAFKAAWLRR
jgi:hypothetical protein